MKRKIEFERNLEMKDNITKIILVLIFIIIILGCIFAFKVLNGDSNEKTYTAKSNYSKTEIIDLIKSENNKSNYEVEYTLNDTKYKRKYLNKKMKYEALDGETNVLSYLDFDKNTNTIINESKKIAVIQTISFVNENYMSDDMLKIVENPNCIIEKEEKISNRNAIILSYNGTENIGNQFLFSADNSTTNNDSKVDEIKYEIKMWIDTETGFLLQTVMKANNNEQKTVYDLKLNTVTIADVTVPNLSQYKVTDMTSKQ